jgi:hypothetical protein
MKYNTGSTIHSPREIAQTFTTHLREKYKHIPIDDNEATALLDHISSHLNTGYANTLAKPFEFGEVYTALASGSNRQAPGIDGLSREFYLHHWALLRDVLHAVLNQMF